MLTQYTANQLDNYQLPKRKEVVKMKHISQLKGNYTQEQQLQQERTQTLIDKKYPDLDFHNLEGIRSECVPMFLELKSNGTELKEQDRTAVSAYLNTLYYINQLDISLETELDTKLLNTRDKLLNTSLKQAKSLGIGFEGRLKTNSQPEELTLAQQHGLKVIGHVPNESEE